MSCVGTLYLPPHRVASFDDNLLGRRSICNIYRMPTESEFILADCADNKPWISLLESLNQQQPMILQTLKNKDCRSIVIIIVITITTITIIIIGAIIFYHIYSSSYSLLPLLSPPPTSHLLLFPLFLISRFSIHISLYLSICLFTCYSPPPSPSPSYSAL